ncbi:Uncharacterised protein [Mycobacteroides abscessus subsp. abscessus]|nr:Uncharacterised protein [Mycobacteroides abscessus subsp. abscessus]
MLPGRSSPQPARVWPAAPSRPQLRERRQHGLPPSGSWPTDAHPNRPCRHRARRHCGSAPGQWCRNGRPSQSTAVVQSLASGSTACCDSSHNRCRPCDRPPNWQSRQGKDAASAVTGYSRQWQTRGWALPHAHGIRRCLVRERACRTRQPSGGSGRWASPERHAAQSAAKPRPVGVLVDSLLLLLMRYRAAGSAPYVTRCWCTSPRWWSRPDNW